MIIEYKCKKCKKIFEIFKNEKIICPNCKSRKVKRIYSTFNVEFKGKGFYKTDKDEEI